MQTPFGRAAEFFGQAYRQQGEAAEYQDRSDDSMRGSYSSNLRLDNPTIGSVPPSLTGNERAEADEDAFMTGFKDSLLDLAQEKKRTTNGKTQLRASGGVNTAVF